MGGQSDAKGGRSPNAVGDLIKELRVERHLSQERLEELVGYGKGSGMVSQIEAGTRGKRISRDRIVAFAQALSVSPRSLLLAAGHSTEGLDPEGRPTFEDFVNADPLLRSDQKRVLIDLYQSYVGRSGG